MQCEAMTYRPGFPQCKRSATLVVGIRYWGDIATDRTYGHAMRRTWVEFWGACYQHRYGLRADRETPMRQWEHEFGPVLFGCANGQRLGWVNLVSGEVHAIPQSMVDIRAASRALTVHR